MTNGQTTPELQDDEPFLDFDAAKKSRKTIGWRYADKDYRISADPSAVAVLTLMREGVDIEALGQSGDPKKDADDIEMFLKLLLGERDLKSMLDEGMGIYELQHLAQFIATHMQLDQNGGASAEGAPDDVTPPSASSTSSSSGRRSRPTSAVST